MPYAVTAVKHFGGMKGLTAVLCMAVLLAAFLCPLTTSVGASQKRARLERAADFLVERYNEELHLVAEGRGYPQNVTYWIYSDNLLCAYALRPYAPRIAREIKKTVSRLINEVGMPGKFEVLFGYVEVLSLDDLL